MTATTSTTARVSNAQLAAKLDGLTDVMTQLLGVIAGTYAGTHATSGAVVEITSAPTARKATASKTSAAKTAKAPAKATASKAKTPKVAKPVDPQAAAKRAEQAAAWAAHKEIRSLVNKAFAAAGVKFTAGTYDRYLDQAAVQAMLAKIDPSRKADAIVFVTAMAAKATEQNA